jgi:CubicO group peptidase (beta-lactamase class C family)
MIAYGTRGLDDPRPVDARTVYDIGSLTKVFTALLLAEDVEAGRLSFDQPVRTCVPAASGLLAHKTGREVTFADLATHTSGLPLRPDNLVSKDPDDKYAGYTAEELLDFLARSAPEHPPGSAYAYSNVGFGLLGLALERCDHADYETLVASRITGPLGMRDTAVEPSPEMRAREAKSYDVDLARPLPHWRMGALVPAGGLRSTADDLLIFLDAALGRVGPGLQPAFRDLTSIQRPGGMQPATAIALGWNIFRDGPRTLVWKNGNVGGFRTFMGYDPGARIGVVALANAQPDGPDDIGLHILDPAIPVNLTRPRRHQEVPIAPEKLDRYTGAYRYSATDIVTIRKVGDHLAVIVPGSEPIPIYAMGPDRFFMKIQDVELTFESFADGRPAKLIWNQDGGDQTGERTGDASPP